MTTRTVRDFQYGIAHIQNPHVQKARHGKTHFIQKGGDKGVTGDYPENDLMFLDLKVE